MKLYYILIAAIFILCGLSFNLGWTAGKKERPNPLPSIADIQKKVGAKADGKIGKETIEKWNRAYCDEQAKRWVR